MDDDAVEGNAREQMDERGTKRRVVRFVFFGCLGFLVLIVGCVAIIVATSGGDDDDYAPPQSATAIGGMSEMEMERMVISQMMEYPQVRDCSVSRDRDNVNLVVIVGAATNEATAKNLGDNFVRMYKSFSDDDPPARSIGPGKYNYLIGVYTPTEEKIALGAKVKAAERITW